MAINQAIYTSSAKGISKGGGMGIHTYNYGCDESELNDFELSYCQYYFSGDTSDIPLLPTKYVYGKTQNNRYMAAAVTYIGKDYDKEVGRMGNLISHMYSFNRDDLKFYPLQLYGSRDFMMSINTAEVDGTREPEYLPEVKSVELGDQINIDTIQEFLGDERMDMFCHLLAAVLHRDEIHKVILYDTHENIIKWIAAVEFSLPLQCAREITFSSYERDPMLSEFDIRGAVVGMSSGDCYSYTADGQFYVFDGVHKECPEFDISADYFQYGINMGLDFSYDALVEFFKFLNRYRYEQADCDIYQGFELFQMVRGGMESLKNEEFLEAVSFEGKYGNKSSHLKMLEQLLKRLHISSKSDDVLVANLRLLILDFYKQMLTEPELKKILVLSLQMDQNLKSCGMDVTDNDEMWNNIYIHLLSIQSEQVEYASRVLSEKSAYRRLGEFESYILKNYQGESIKRTVSKFYAENWTNATKGDARYFDLVVYEAVKILYSYKDDDKKYHNAMSMFLLIQEMGKGYIAGKGCRELIHILESGTNLTDKKQYKVNKKNTNQLALDKRLNTCAMEVLSYVQQNRADIPIARIRIKHLTKCIIKANEQELFLTESEELKIYVSDPIIINDIPDKELNTYFKLLGELVASMIITREEYQMLFSFWKLTDKQKKMLINVFFEMEFDYFLTEKEITGIKSILGAAAVLDDDGYTGALKDCLADMKRSYIEKITHILNSEPDIYKYWKELLKAPYRDNKRKLFEFRR